MTNKQANEMYHRYSAFGVLCRRIRMNRGIRQGIWRFRTEVEEVKGRNDRAMAKGNEAEMIALIGGELVEMTDNIHAYINRLEQIQEEKRKR